MSKNSRIIGLRVRNVKRLTAVDYAPDPEASVIGVGGKNAAGKSSLLDAIEYALAGTKSIPQDAVRKGAKTGEIEVELDDFTVKRVIGQKNSRLEIRGKDGTHYASPQTLLDELTGKLTFDPLRFQRLGETPAGRREQAEMLRQLVGLDFSDLERNRKALFDSRTDANRQLKQVTATLSTMPHHSGVPKVEIRMQDLMSRFDKANETNQAIAVKRRDIQQQERTIEELKKRILQLEEELGRRTAMKIQDETALEEMKEVDVSALKEEIASAETTNQKIRANQKRDGFLHSQDSLQKNVDQLNREIEQIDEEKQSRLNKAKMPIEGLSFTEDAVLYNGVPFENCSSAEQLKLSVAMGIAMNPKLRIMLIRDGSLLDESSREMLRGMASAADQQIWIEFVDKDQECAIIIEDGMIAGAQ